jgi:hypothetical protein
MSKKTLEVTFDWDGHLSLGEIREIMDYLDDCPHINFEVIINGTGNINE